MISMLSGNKETVAACKASAGQTITSAEIKDENLILKFENGSGIRIFDDGQSCCESRYMVCDDKLDEFIGTQLLDIEVKDGPSTSGEDGGEHEQQFVDIKTSKGVFQIRNHNQHNGYYGEFSIVARLLDA